MFVSVLISHLVWVLLGVLLILALLGVSHHNQTINIGNLVSDPALVSITGRSASSQTPPSSPLQVELPRLSPRPHLHYRQRYLVSDPPSSPLQVEVPRLRPALISLTGRAASSQSPPSSPLQVEVPRLRPRPRLHYTIFFLQWTDH